MKIIHKHVSLTGERKIKEFPKIAKVLSVEEHGITVKVYMLVDKEEKETKLYDFRIYSTGEFIECGIEEYQYLESVQRNGKGPKLHIFYKELEAE